MSTVDGLVAGLTLTTGASYGLDPAVDIVLTGLDGWDGGGSIRRMSTPRLNAPGDFAERGYRGARLVSATGEATFPTRAQAARFMLDAVADLADGEAGVLTVHNTDLNLTMHLPVYLDEVADVKLTGETDVSFSFDMIAPDPLKLGVPELVAVWPYSWTNTGTATGRLVFQVAGVFPHGFTITETLTGAVLAYTTSFDGTAAPLVIDVTTGRVTHAGFNLAAGLTTREWTRVLPGQSAAFDLFGVDATNPQLILKGTSTWH
ncbi:hypothetical protein [Cryobacterium sp. SO1]|uniref:hypothetical protein n=1 Tax=Cryobacterium sp. SO1 TaxID=1897061 RepID=UPI0010230842|nr:hypothetical protein [Cryobacterium sp. SO1]RZI35312.1 hypothetical protein BJQ95_02379 [Cryobacterium sp. SO1]